MFGVDLSEFMVIGVVALIVIGPEKLPRVARTAGLLLGRLQRHVAEVKADISREIQLEEMKRLQAEMLESARELEQNIQSQVREVEQGVQAQMHEVQQAIQPVVAEPDASVDTALAAEAEPANKAVTTTATAETQPVLAAVTPPELGTAEIPPMTQFVAPSEPAGAPSGAPATEPAEPVDDGQLDLFAIAPEPRKS
jgi:sec-independent protein translocase protein TatB